MEKEKIIAMWEEDGDLMRIKKYFTYLYGDEQIKERIKQKTLAILDSKGDTVLETNDFGNLKKTIEFSQSDDNKNESTLSKIKAFRNRVKSLSRKRSLKMVSAAAAILLFIYLGITGLLEKSHIVSTQSFDYKSANFQDAALAGAPPKGDAGIDENNSYSLGPKAELSLAENSLKKDMDKAQFKNIQQKIIYILEATLKVENVNAAVNSIENRVRSLGGYIAESRLNNVANNNSAYLSIRIPSSQFASLKNALSEFGTVTNQYLYTDDITKEYYDVETRLRNWEAQEKRYLEILRQAKTVEDILKIEDSLANVRREIEHLKGQLKYWDHRVDYSEIKLHIYPSKNDLAVSDPWQPVSFKSTIIAAKNAVIKTISFIWNSLNYLVIIIGYLLPLIVIFLAGWLIYWNIRKNK